MKPLEPGKLPPDLLHRLLEGHAPTDERVLIGPGVGRDSAALAFGESVLVIKSDPITFPTEQPATHLLHINANDIVCQGAIPRWIVVTALLPAGSTTEASVERLFGELQAAAHALGVSVIGGHTEITIGLDRPILVGTMLGEATRASLVDPTAAKPGDRLLITKSVGIEGTALLASEFRDRLSLAGWSSDDIAQATGMLAVPGISIVREARALTEAGVVSALHDPTEGGVASALREMAIAAGCGLFISGDAIPISPETQRLADDLGINPLGLLASGSLLAAVPREQIEAAEAALHKVEVPFVWIGKLTPSASGFRMRAGIFDGPLPEFATDEVARILSERG